MLSITQEIEEHIPSLAKKKIPRTSESKLMRKYQIIVKKWRNGPQNGTKNNPKSP